MRAGAFFRKYSGGSRWTDRSITESVTLACSARATESHTGFSRSWRSRRSGTEPEPRGVSEGGGAARPPGAERGGGAREGREDPARRGGRGEKKKKKSHT